MVWDEVPTTFFEGKPLNADLVGFLKTASLLRQEELPEFAYLRKGVNWFKERQQEKLVSLNLDRRREQQTEDKAFLKELKQEKKQLADLDFPYQEFRLGPPPPPPIKAEPKADDLDDEDEDLADADENAAFSKVDVHLKECLRVVGDAIALAQNKQYWVSNRPPLTAPADKG